MRLLDARNIIAAWSQKDSDVEYMTHAYLNSESGNFLSMPPENRCVQSVFVRTRDAERNSLHPPAATTAPDAIEGGN